MTDADQPVSSQRVGFTDRFREAAEAARAKLAEHGVLNDADAIHGVQAVDPHSQDISIANRAMALGAPDPYSLITHDEVVALTGIPVGGPSLTYADDDLGVRFELTGDPAGSIDIEVTDRARVVGGLSGDPTVNNALPGDRFMRIAGGRLSDSDDPRRDVSYAGDATLGGDFITNLPFMI